MFLGHSAMILFVALLALCKSLFLTIAAGEWHPWLVEDSASGEGFLIDSYYEEHGDPLAQAVPVTLLELQQQPDALTKQNLAKSQNLLHCQCQFTKIPPAAQSDGNDREQYRSRLAAPEHPECLLPERDCANDSKRRRLPFVGL